MPSSRIAIAAISLPRPCFVEDLSFVELFFEFILILGDEEVEFILHDAKVAELADALRSGRSDRKVVRVRVPPLVPKHLPSGTVLFYWL